MACTLNATKSIPGHSITAVSEIKSSLWATAGGKGGLKPAPNDPSQAARHVPSDSLDLWQDGNVSSTLRLFRISYQDYHMFILIRLRQSPLVRTRINTCCGCSLSQDVTRETVATLLQAQSLFLADALYLTPQNDARFLEAPVNTSWVRARAALPK